MKLLKGLSSAIILLFYASFASAQGQYAVTIINYPGATSTYVYGSLGNELWGNYLDANDNGHGFLYDISKSTYTSSDYPGAVNTTLMAYSKNKLLGIYSDTENNYHFFIYNISNSTYAAFDVPNYNPAPFGPIMVNLSGNNAWGYYWDTDNNQHWFLATPTREKLPLITSLSPKSGSIGATVTIKGNYFGSTQGESTVLFNDTPATTYISWSNNTIKCTVPTDATTGPVVVTTTDGASDGKTFTVQP